MKATLSKILPKIGKNLASLRREAGFTQEMLAEKVGVSPRYIQGLEADEYFPSLPNLFRLKTCLKCNWDQLLKSSDDFNSGMA